MFTRSRALRVLALFLLLCSAPLADYALAHEDGSSAGSSRNCPGSSVGDSSTDAACCAVIQNALEQDIDHWSSCSCVNYITIGPGFDGRRCTASYDGHDPQGGGGGGGEGDPPDDPEDPPPPVTARGAARPDEPEPPDAPEGLTAVPGDRLVALSWTSGSGHGWQVQLKSGGRESPWTAIPGGRAGTMFHVVRGLANGVAYRFRVRAVNSAGAGEPSVWSEAATPMPPDPPGAPQLAVAAGDARANLSWNPGEPGDRPTTGWQVQFAARGQPPGSWEWVPRSSGETSSHTVEGLANGDVYRFRVRALSSAGAGEPSAWSAPLSPWPLPCAAQRITAAAVRSADDLEAFVRCAFEEVLARGPSLAAEAFAADGRWGSVVTRVTVRRPNGTLLAGADGPAPGWERVAGSRGRGWVYDSVPDAEGREVPRAAYGIAVDWLGARAWVGASIAPRELPGACPGGGLRAASLAVQPPSRDRLRAFVRCAALELEARGGFAAAFPFLPVLWSSGAVYVFALDPGSGRTLFTASPAGGPELPLAPAYGRGAWRGVLAAGEAWLYYPAAHPVTGRPGRKVAFVRRALVNRVPVLVGAGYLEPGPP